MILVNQRIASEPSASWASFCQHNKDLFESDKGILKKYYCQSTLDSDFARRVFVLPDLIQ